MLPPVRATLAASSAVTNFIGSNPVRAYRHGEAPKGVAKPYVTWFMHDGVTDGVLDAPEADTFRLQLDCWSDDDAQVETLAAAVRDQMETVAVLVSYGENGRDPETQRYRIGFLFDWILGR
jgi:hypothetical protein